MVPMPLASCAGSPKPSSNRSCYQSRDKDTFEFPVSDFTCRVLEVLSGSNSKHEIRNSFIQMSDNQSLNIAVIGGGPGGYAAAFLAADLGMSATLIDPEPNPGGVCLYRGCIPSKALLRVAKLLEESHQAKDWGITFATHRIDL